MIVHYILHACKAFEFATSFGGATKQIFDTLIYDREMVLQYVSIIGVHCYSLSESVSLEKGIWLKFSSMIICWYYHADIDQMTSV